MEKRVVWIPVKALVRFEVEVESGLDKQAIFKAAVEDAYEYEGIHLLPTDDFMIDDDEIQGDAFHYLRDDLVEDMF